MDGHLSARPLIHLVGHPVEECHDQFLAALLVGPGADPAGEVGDCLFVLRRDFPYELAHSLIKYFRSVEVTQQQQVQFTRRPAHPFEVSVLAGRWQEEVRDGNLKGGCEHGYLVRVELPVALPVPRALEFGDHGGREANTADLVVDLGIPAAGGLDSNRPGGNRYATVELLQLEDDIARFFVGGASQTARLDADMAVCRQMRFGDTDETSLDGEQLAAACAIAGGGQGHLLSGAAGTGKTYTLQAVAHLAQQRGVRIEAMAPARSAAEELGDHVGVDGINVDRRLRDPLSLDPPVGSGRGGACCGGGGTKSGWMTESGCCIEALGAQQRDHPTTVKPYRRAPQFDNALADNGAAPVFVGLTLGGLAYTCSGALLSPNARVAGLCVRSSLKGRQRQPASSLRITERAGPSPRED